jgi:predicted hydrocarbon binding protein
MDRKEFLKSVCMAGLCGCAFSSPGASSGAAAAEPSADEQRLAFARYQLAKMLGFLSTEAPGATCATVLEKTGRECARLGTLVATFKGNPEGYFAAATKAWGTEFVWDKARGVVTIAVAPGPCGCPLVDPRRTPAVWCNCSVGYQKEAFETVFGKPVQAKLKESKLAGSDRCVFEVTVGQAG